MRVRILLPSFSAGGKAVEDSPLRVTRWVDDENLDFAGAVIMFSLRWATLLHDVADDVCLVCIVSVAVLTVPLRDACEVCVSI